MNAEPLLGYGAVALIAGSLLVLVEPGRLATPDSTNYLNAALHLAEGHGLVTSAREWEGAHPFSPLAVFAPGFPALLATVLKLEPRPYEAMAATVALSFVAYALLGYRVLRLATPSRSHWLAAALMLPLLLEPAVVGSLRLALSDLFGAAFAVWWVPTACTASLESRRARLLFGGMLGLSILARWSNLYLAAPAVLAVFAWAWPEARWRTRVASVLEVGLGVLLVVLPWWTRNFLTAGTLMGPRTLALSNPLLHVGRAAAGLGDGYLLAHEMLAPDSWLRLSHAALACGVAGPVLWCALASRERITRTLALLALGYAGLMVLSSTLVRIDPLSDTRFWLLAYPLLIALCARTLLGHELPRVLTRPALAASSALVLHATAVYITAPGLRESHTARGYFASYFEHSRTLAEAVAMHDAGRCLLSTHDEFALLPRVGTRPLQLVRLPELTQLGSYEGPQLCFLLIRDRRMTPSADGQHDEVRQVVHQQLARRRLLKLVTSDGVAELWLSRAVSRSDLAHADRSM